MAGGGHGEGSVLSPFTWIKWFIELVFDLKAQVTYVSKWGVSRALYLGSVWVGLYFVLGHLIPSLPAFTVRWMLATAPIWIPVGLVISFWHSWVWYIQALFLSGRNPVLLEMKLPREIMKSPRAMELAITNLAISSGESTFIHRAWKGQIRTYFSFEIASFGGEIHFYIWCWKNYKNAVEAGIYAQYPEVELVEVEDYASRFQFDKSIHSCFATEWQRSSYMVEPKTGTRDLDAYPIKTYIDFELDKDPKEEHKIDPIAQVLEFMGTIKPNEQIWVQIVLRKAGNYGGVLFPKEMDHEWQDAVRRQVRAVRLLATVLPHEHETVADALAADPSKFRFPNPTESQKEQLQSMERNFGKYPFEVGMRGVYITTGDLHGPTYSGLRYLWRPFNNPQYRSQLTALRWTNNFDYPWQDIHDIRLNLVNLRFFDAFRRRSFFTSPWKMPTFVMTNEELASLWHPPSSTVQTPGLERIPATKGSAPANLPR